MKTVQLKDTVDQIEASSLSIGYPGHSPVLSGIDQQWHGPGIHLIIGENGSGKSTLLGLLSQIYYPQEGEISILTRNIGYVGVTPLILDGSLRENLLYGNENLETTKGNK